MKAVNHAVIRGVLAFLLGLVLVIWPEAAITYLVITIGILFILPGLFALITYFLEPKGGAYPSVRFPIEAAGSVLLGVWLVVMPAFFVNFLMYVLGVLLLIGGIQQLISLFRAKKYTPVPLGFYIIPALLLITGIVILLNPFETVAVVFIIFGAASMVYGISEFVTWFRFRPRKAEIVEY